MTTIMPIANRAMASRAIADRRGTIAVEHGLTADVLAVDLAATFGTVTGRQNNASDTLTF
ncbi:MAG: hypothetical protein IT555_20495 [Acetobacteraceae bacterium]|nr:hypothetical protein [Acetobacteraceae bacterium]